MTLTLDNIARDVCLRYPGNRKKASFVRGRRFNFGSLRFSLCTGYLSFFLLFSIMSKITVNCGSFFV